MKTTLTADDAAGWYECEITGSTSKRAFIWNGTDLRWGNAITLGEHTNFRRLYTEGEVNEICEKNSSCEKVLTDSYTDAIESLAKAEAELTRLKSSPYVMRKADRPDCVGLWLDADMKVVHAVSDSKLYESAYFGKGVFYYLGPIPVIPKEQQPPKVVTIRSRVSGEVHLAIQSQSGRSFVTLNDDGFHCGLAFSGDWEVIQ